MAKNSLRFLLGFVCVVFSRLPALASEIPGADWYSVNAEVIALVRNQTGQEAAAFPPPSGHQRLLVLEILKGVSFQQNFVLPSARLGPGQKAVLLIPYTLPEHYMPVFQMSPRPIMKMRLWPMNADQTIETGDIPARTEFGAFLMEEKLRLDQLKTYIARATPEEPGLSQLITDAILFPETVARLRQQDAKRAQYVELVLTIRDLPRDIPALAALLESSRSAVRNATERKLLHLTSTNVPRPTDADAASLNQWALSWKRWWNAHYQSLAWNEELQAWKQQEAPRSPRAWPPVPKSETPPSEGSLIGLILALEKEDSVAFGVAFRIWIDSGVLRDRDILQACSLENESWREQGALDGACGMSAFSPPAPRLPSNIVLDRSQSARDRVYVIALVASLWRFDQFSQERRAAREHLQSATACSEDVRRAAFWELRDENFQTPGEVALKKLVNCPDPSTTPIFLSTFLHQLDDATISAAQERLKAGDKVFAQGLLDYIQQNCDRHAGWAAHVLFREGFQPEVIPVMQQWLKSSNPQCRKAAAVTLCWNPSAVALPELLAAYRGETADSAREFELVAIAEIGDPATFDLLMAVAKQPLKTASETERETERGTESDFNYMSEIGLRVAVLRGLARTHNPRCLRTLAEASQSKDHSIRDEGLDLFGYVSGLYQGHPPAAFESFIWIDPKTLDEGPKIIAKWLKSH